MVSAPAFGGNATLDENTELQQVLWFDEYTAHAKREVKRDMQKAVKLLIPELVARVQAEIKSSGQKETGLYSRKRNCNGTCAEGDFSSPTMLDLRSRPPLGRGMEFQQRGCDFAAIMTRVEAELMPKIKAEIKDQVKADLPKHNIGDGDDLIKRFKSYWEMWIDEKRKSLNRSSTSGGSARNGPVGREVEEVRNGMDATRMQIQELHALFSNFQAGASIEKARTERLRLEENLAMIRSRR
jgi:hypothetical protein